MQGHRVLQEAPPDGVVLLGHVVAKPVWSSDPTLLITMFEAGALPAAGTSFDLCVYRWRSRPGRYGEVPCKGPDNVGAAPITKSQFSFMCEAPAAAGWQ
jgi:hypothetical protein